MVPAPRSSESIGGCEADAGCAVGHESYTSQRQACSQCIDSQPRAVLLQGWPGSAWRSPNCLLSVGQLLDEVGRLSELAAVRLHAGNSMSSLTGACTGWITNDVQAVLLLSQDVAQGLGTCMWAWSRGHVLKADGDGVLASPAPLLHVHRPVNGHPGSGRRSPTVQDIFACPSPQGVVSTVTVHLEQALPALIFSCKCRTSYTSDLAWIIWEN